jgi:hypothetical protein
MPIISYFPCRLHTTSSMFSASTYTLFAYEVRGQQNNAREP